MKRQTTNRKKIFATSVTDKGRVARIYEELLHVRKKKTTQQKEKGKDMTMLFHKKKSNGQQIKKKKKKKLNGSTTLAIKEMLI